MLETHPIQGLLLSAYHKQTSAMYLFLSIPETERARARAIGPGEARTR